MKKLLGVLMSLSLILSCIINIHPAHAAETVTGTLVDAKGTLIKNASVNFYEGKGYEKHIEHAMTNEKGEFQINPLTNGKIYTINIYPPYGENPYVVTKITITYNGADSLKKLILNTANFTGKVVDSAGKPLKDGYVSLRNESDQVNLSSQITNGTFKFGGLIEGKTYQIQASPFDDPNSVPSKETSFTYNKTSSNNFIIKLSKVEIKGIVIDPAGKGKPYVSVHIFDENHREFQSTSTDSKGAYRFGNLTPGKTYTINTWVSPDETYVSSTSKTIQYQGKLLTIPSLQLRKPQMTGKAVDSQGKSYTNGRVILTDLSSPGLTEESELSMKGTYQLAGLIKGHKYQIKVETYQDNKNFPTAPIEFVYSGKNPNITLKLTKPQILVKITDASGKAMSANSMYINFYEGSKYLKYYELDNKGEWSNLYNKNV